jgi:hypothetical protein
VVVVALSSVVVAANLSPERPGMRYLSASQPEPADTS